MARMTGFRILGDLEVADESGSPVAFGGPREQRLLAALLIEANHTVSVDRLIDAVWDADPPASAGKVVRNLISRLNALIEPAAGSRRVETVGSGYRLRIAQDDFDAACFNALITRAARSGEDGDAAGAARQLREALGLWRGPALSGLGGLVIETAARGWNERRLAAQEAYIDLLLVLDRHDEAVALLTELTAQNPFRQKLVGQLMAALDAGGRQTEALSLYRDFQRRLGREFGIDPSQALQDAHIGILRGQRSTSAAAAATTTVPARAVEGTPSGTSGTQPGASTGFAVAVPRQLPAPIRHFVGRDQYIRMLTEQLADPAAPGGTVLISAIDGTAGIGKSALAVNWAWQIADRCPAGQLFTDLHGFDPVRAPADPLEVLRGFLDALGVPPARVPPGIDAQIGLYRSLLADRRALVVLDNARDADQVRPLLPGGRLCVVVVTSRRQLTGLVAAEGAVPVTLDLLSREESRQLLTRRLGMQRVSADAEATDQLLDICGGLPLALSIAAAHAAQRPNVPLRDLVKRLREEARLLDGFDTGEAATSPRAVFSWSYRDLNPGAARMFRHLGLQPGHDCSAVAAARLADVPLPRARAQLAELARSNLVGEQVPGRFALHDLLAAFAHERACERETPADTLAALERVLDYYLTTAQTAGQLLDPTRHLSSAANAPAVAQSGIVAEDTEVEVATHEQALAWFEAEHAVLVAAVDRAFEAGLDQYAWRIPWSLTTSFDRRARWAELTRVLRVALTAAERSGDTAGQARAHRGLGNCAVQLNDFAAAEAHFRSALAVFVRLGDLSGQAAAELGLSWATARDSRHDVALEHALRGLALYRDAGNRVGAANALNAAGWQHAKLADYPAALAACAEALEVMREVGDRQGAAATLDSLGYARFHLADFPEAIAHYREAVDLRQDLGDRYGRAGTLIRLGDAHDGAGDHDAAIAVWREALGILEDLRHPDADEARGRLTGIRLAASHG